ncbi:Pentatricopeptide repeat-containing protein, mitochondrial [Glycine max]|nr:Pentatricopeptide repeat-containing protein, mitochondrial [Glycine max]
MPFTSSTGPPTTTTTPTHSSATLPSLTSCSLTPSPPLQLTLRQPHQHVHQRSRPPRQHQGHHSLVPWSEYLHKGHCVYSCNAILGVLMRANCVNIAKAIYDQVLTEAVLELDVYTYTTMICGLCKVGMVESARKVFEEMVSHGMNPDVKAYRVVVVNEYCKIRKPSEAVLLLREMVVRRVKPSMSSFNAVFRVLVDEGKLNKRVILLKQMPKMGCSPNFLFYCTMICGLCKVKGRMQQVEELILDMLQNGHNLDATMYNCLLAGYCQDRDEERTPKIVMT